MVELPGFLLEAIPLPTPHLALCRDGKGRVQQQGEVRVQVSGDSLPPLATE